MVNLTGEASSSRQKRQRVLSTVDEKGENGGGDVVTRSGTLLELDLLDCSICCNALTVPIYQCDNGHVACSFCCLQLRHKCPSCALPIGNNRSRIMERVVEAVIVSSPNAKQHGGDVVARSGTLLKLDLLDCPLCSKALTSRIFQCDNGHVACSSCCYELRYKCPSCAAPIGNYRSRIMERVVQAIIVPCPNAKYGCNEKFSYGKELIHEKKCSYALCYCPAPNCNYSGVYKDLYSHYYANHKESWNEFECAHSIGAWLRISEKILVLQEYRDGPLVAVQCFKELRGMYVSVNCIAPCAPGVGQYSYELSYSMASNTMILKSEKMNRIQKVSFQNPEKDFMSIPYYLVGEQQDALKMNICIRRLESDKEEADEEEADEDEDDEEEVDEEEYGEEEAE